MVDHIPSDLGMKFDAESAPAIREGLSGESVVSGEVNGAWWDFKCLRVPLVKSGGFRQKAQTLFSW
jgi:hypothetical protein